MWTHANKMWTDADCPQKCGQMWTINADSTKTRSMQRAMYGIVSYGIVHLWSCKQALHFVAINLALVSGWFIWQELIFGHCRQLRTKDADIWGLSAIMRKNADKLCKNATNCGHAGMKMLRYRKVMSNYLSVFTYDFYYTFQLRESTYST